MAIGIVGLIIYCVFQVWAWVTAPSGPQKVQANGNSIALAGSLITML